MIFRYFILILTVVLAGVVLTGGSYAQSSDPQRPEPQRQQEAQPQNQQEIEDGNIIQEVVTGKKDEYVDPTLKNLSKLYWAIGKLDIDEDRLIDYYLMINECDLYMQYYHNDFEWDKIREATRKSIMKNMSEFPRRFELMVPVSLDRYNQEKEQFEIIDADKIVGMRRLDFAINMLALKRVCTHSGEIEEYPANLIIELNRPLVITHVPVKRELAELYIEEAKRFYESLPPKLQHRYYERVAFLRVKVHITQYKNTIQVVGGKLRAVVFGTVEGYEVYADAKKMKPLYYKDMSKQRFRRLRGMVTNADHLDGNKKEEEVDIKDMKQ